MDQLFKDRVNQFLAQKSIAIAGYSTEDKQVANQLYKKFNDNGYQVFAINPKAEEIKDIHCYPNLYSIPEKPDAVMICTPPKGTLEILKTCIEIGIKHAWIHCSFGTGSFNEEAEKMAEESGIELIPRGCPNMFLEADGFHKCVKWFMGIQGRMKING